MVICPKCKNEICVKLSGYRFFCTNNLCGHKFKYSPEAQKRLRDGEKHSLSGVSRNQILLSCFDKIEKLKGFCIDGYIKNITVCNIKGVKEIWLCGFKFINNNGVVTIRDLDYWVLDSARIVDNEDYIDELCAEIIKADAKELFENRADRIFLRKKVRGISPFSNLEKIPNSTKRNLIDDFFDRYKKSKSIYGECQIDIDEIDVKDVEEMNKKMHLKYAELYVCNKYNISQFMFKDIIKNSDYAKEKLKQNTINYGV